SLVQGRSWIFCRPSRGATTFSIKARLIVADKGFSLASDSPNREWTANNFEGFLRPLVANRRHRGPLRPGRLSSAERSTIRGWPPPDFGFENRATTSSIVRYKTHSPCQLL